MDRFYKSFFVEQKFDKIKETPIFHLYEILKDIELSKLKHWSTLYEYYKQKSNFSEKIGAFLMKYNELKEFYSTKKELIDELNTTYERIEFKIIGEYLKKEKK